MSSEPVMKVMMAGYVSPNDDSLRVEVLSLAFIVSQD